MRIALVFSLIIATLAVVFALQNPGQVDLDVGPYTVRGALALVLMITFGMGLLVGFLATVPSRIKKHNQIKLLQRQLDEARNPDAEERTIAGDPVGGVPPARSTAKPAPEGGESSPFAPPSADR
jgi:putative membrane protein